MWSMRQVTDINHVLAGVAREEGLIFASEIRSALDLLCARYMFKNVPRRPSSPDRSYAGNALPRYSAGAIVTDPGARFPPVAGYDL